MVNLKEYIQTELEVQKIIWDSKLKNHFEIRHNVKWRMLLK